LTVPITMEEYIRQAEGRAVLRAPVKMRLEGLTLEQRLQGLSAEQLLEMLTPEQIVARLKPEAREKLRRFLDESASGLSEDDVFGLFDIQAQPKRG
jgi:hypothetical protein